MSDSKGPVSGLQATSAPTKGSGLQQSAHLPADQHFVRQVVIGMVKGHVERTTSPIDAKRAEAFVRQAQLVLDVVKKVEGEK